MPTSSSATPKSRKTFSLALTVVTSPLHTRRACAAFEHLGLTVTCVGAGQYHWWTWPYDAVYEQLGWIKYRMKGWI